MYGEEVKTIVSDDGQYRATIYYDEDGYHVLTDTVDLLTGKYSDLEVIPLTVDFGNRNTWRDYTATCWLKDDTSSVDVSDIRYAYEYGHIDSMAAAVIKHLERAGAPYVLVGARYSQLGGWTPTVVTDPDDAIAVLAAPKDSEAPTWVEGVFDEITRIADGEVYGIIIERAHRGAHLDPDEEPEWEEVDSCWGFVGDEYAEGEARRMMAEAAPMATGNEEG